MHSRAGNSWRQLWCCCAAPCPQPAITYVVFWRQLLGLRQHLPRSRKALLAFLEAVHHVEEIFILQGS